MKTITQLLLILAVLIIPTFLHATTCDLFSSTSLNNNYSCSLPTSQLVGQQISSCNITFTSCNGSGLLYCDLGDGKTLVDCGTQNGSTQTWTCTLNADELTFLNDCISTGNCSLDLACSGYYSIGDCSLDYTCTQPKTQNVPDAGATFWLLGLGLLCVESARRQFAFAKA